MKHSVILTGDINLLGVSDPAVPFAQVGETLRAANLVFSNLECCFYEPGTERSVEDEGFYATLKAAEALKLGGIHAVGNANNVNFGGPAIRSSLKRLDAVGILHTGAGNNREEAYRPIILERDGIRYGFMQRTSVYWSHGHEATDSYPGVATVKAHTAYRPRIEELKTLTRPGMPPEVVTWADSTALSRFKDDIADLRRRVDFLVASNHWGLDHEVLDYQCEIGRAAVDAGADLVLGHGPHHPLGIEIYKEKPIFYSMGSFSFLTGHKARKHPDWIGLMVRLSLDSGALQKATFSFVRHNDKNETIPRPLSAEQDELENMREMSKPFGASLTTAGDEVVVWTKR